VEAERPADRVDEVQAAWRAELPGWDVSSVGIVGRAVELVHWIEQARSAGLAAHGSDRATFDLLATLRRAGPPYRLTVGELQRLSLVTTGAVSQRVERAARAGLVRRTPVPGDARKVVVELTEQGRAAAAELLRVVLDAEQSVLEPLDADERRALEELLRAWSVRLGAARAVGPPS
jgi:DNA-binding MarR family transcriptional regulator